jgi:hypothetical protein
VFRAGECAIGHILIVSFVKEIVGGKRKTYFADYMPNGGCVKKNEVLDIAFREFGEKVLSS